MINHSILEQAGLTEGQAKVYLALLELGASTTGPIIEKAGVARSFIYLLLEQLIEKGLVSYVTKDKTKYFQASDPQKLLEYMDFQQQELVENKNQLSHVLPELLLLQKMSPEMGIRVYEGFKGVQTAFNHYKDKCQKGDAYYCYGMHPIQHERYHIYWNKHHKERVQEGISSYMLFNQGTDVEIMKNRNNYDGCDTRYMPIDVTTDSWFMTFKDTAIIFFQNKNIAIEIVNPELANTFKAYFDELWKDSKPFTEE